MGCCEREEEARYEVREPEFSYLIFGQRGDENLLLDYLACSLLAGGQFGKGELFSRIIDSRKLEEDMLPNCQPLVAISLRNGAMTAAGA